MDTDTGGANRFWTSPLSHIAEARQLALAGQLADAEKLLHPHAGEVETDEGLAVIAWIRRDYALSSEQMLLKLRQAMPAGPSGKEVSKDDVDRWRMRGELQHRVLDRQYRFFRSEPANLFRFCEEAKQRRPAVDAKPTWTQEAHIVRVLAAADREGRPDVVPIRHRVTYSITINKDAPGIRNGAKVRVWLPFPQSYRQQSRVYLVSTSPADGKVAPEGTIHRCVYFEHTVADQSPLKFEVIFEFATSAWCPKLDDAHAKLSTDPVMKPYLGERPPHIVFTPELRAAVAEVVGDEQNPLARVRRIFHWVDKQIAYNSEEEYGIVPSLVRKALASRRGDCGVQAMLFITMCRCAGIPARWQSGWETQRSKWNMHDWCEFHLEPWGWLPADPSYGLRKHDDPRVREFFIGHMDAYRIIVNSDFGRPLWPEKKSMRSEPLDFQRGEVEVDGKNLYFDQWDWDFNVKWLDEGP